MKVEFSTRAVADIRAIADYHASRAGSAAGERLADRICDLVGRIARLPASGRPVTGRHGVRVVPLLRQRYNIFYFYAAGDDGIRILHIRHTSRRPWSGESG